ncbi:MAG: PHP domain-containing protein [Firmicutes bacterium]|nr:PHP domain-containing protein [Bacillota bacterium]
MRFKVDHDYHIHSQLSTCSSDPAQTPERILAYAEQFGLKTICLTDHFWDEKVPGASKWYEPQNFAHVASVKPLPQSENVRFFFGCEAEMDKYDRLGISKERLSEFDFIIVPTTHLHMSGFTIAEEEMSAEGRAKAYVRRFESLLKMDLPFEKVGIAHLTCPLMYPKHNHHDVLDLVSDAVFLDLFKEAAKKGLGIELNTDIDCYQGEAREKELRPYFLAREAGCRFYLGSDAHHPIGLDYAVYNFNNFVDALDLKEEEKFDPFGGITP